MTASPSHDQSQAAAESSAPEAGRTAWSMETVIEAMRRLRASGYIHELQASDSGQLRCGTCGSFTDPENVSIAETIRFEGQSNPDDQAILMAIVCPGGCLGQYSAAFGSTAAAFDTEVLQRLSRATKT